METPRLREFWEFFASGFDKAFLLKFEAAVARLQLEGLSEDEAIAQIFRDLAFTDEQYASLLEDIRHYLAGRMAAQQAKKFR